MKKLEPLIGTMPLVILENISTFSNAKLYAKLEGQYPANSLKERTACYKIKTVIENGVLVTKEDVITQAKLLATQERIMGGMSTGGSLTCKLRIAEKIKEVIFIACNRRDRYLGSKLYN